MQIATQSDADRLYSLLKGQSLDPGTLYTKAELSAAIGKPIENHRAALYRVIRRLERNDLRTLTCVTGVGYRVAQANETPQIVATRRKRARRQISRGLHTSKHTDRSLLTQEERQELDRVTAAQAALQQDMRRLEKRMSLGEARLDTLEREPRLTREEVKQFRDLLRREKSKG